MDQQTLICATADSKILTIEPNEDQKGVPNLRIVDLNNASDQDQLTLNQDLHDLDIHVVVSILSGTQEAASFFEKVLTPLLDVLDLSGIYTVEYTKDAKTVIDLTKTVFVKNANQGIKQLIILLSGDGGIVDILNSIPSPSASYVPPQVSLIPLGTGNALANSSGIMRDKTWGLSTLARGELKPLPIFRATFSSGARLLADEARKEEHLPLRDERGRPFMYGAVVCSWGMHASLVADSDTAAYRKFGVERFKMAAKEALYPSDKSGPHKYKGKLSLLRKGAVDWTPVDRVEHAYVLTTLVSNLEKGFTISPLSEPLDGSLRVVHFGPMSGDEIMGLMNKAYQGGRHVDESVVSYEEVDGVRISFENLEDDGRWHRICLDGKIIRVESDGWIEIRKEPNQLLTLRHLR